jgi:hypothetical protein
MRTVMINTSLPPSINIEVLHVASLFARASSSGYQSALFRDLRNMGKHMYLHGKVVTWQGRAGRMPSRFSYSHLIGMIALLERFVYSPDASPKQLRSCLAASNSSVVGLTNIATSLAYIEILCITPQRCSGSKIPSSSYQDEKMRRSRVPLPQPPLMEDLTPRGNH